MRKLLIAVIAFLLLVLLAFGIRMRFQPAAGPAPAPLMEHISAYNFKEKVLDSGIPVVVDFWAEWCGPCRMLAPLLAEVAEEHEGKVRILKVDADASRDLLSQYKVEALPTLILFRNGREVRRSMGLIPRDSLERFIAQP